MESLSRNKKIGIFSLVICALILLGLFGTGTLSFSGLKSDVLNQTCTQEGQKRKLPQYTAFLAKRNQAQKTLDLVSGEIVVLNKKISEQSALIQNKQQQIVTKNAKIAEIDTFLEKNCKNPKTANSKICKEKKQQRKDLSQDVQILRNTISIAQNAIQQFKNQIGNKQRLITQQQQLIARFTVFIDQYELCERQLNAQPTLTSPLMSGEARMSGEVLVSGEVSMSGEVTLIGKTIISGEVFMSGEPCVSGEVRVPLYRVAVTTPYPAKTLINSIDFTMAFGNPETIKLTDIYVTEEGQGTPLYKCFFLDQNQTQLNCLPGTEGVVNSETRNYILSAKVTGMTGPASLKVYGASIAYNGGKVDAINQTSPIKIHYAPEAMCENKKPSITILSPNGGGIVNILKPFIVSFRTNIVGRHSISISDETLGIGYSLSEIVFPQSQIGESKVQFTQVFVPINYNLNVNNKYKIEICAGNNICDKSDGVFLIESTPIATCTDSDGGKDYFKKGTLLVYNDGAPGEKVYTDMCQTDGKTLLEYNCMSYQVGNSQITGSSYFTCPNGCSDGACTPISQDLYKGNSWNCYDGTGGVSTICQSLAESRADAEKMCQGHCSKETGKCGVNGFSAGTLCSTNPPQNGQCSSVLNQCIAGMLQDIPDNNTLYMWNCLGVNGGVNAICSAPIKDTTAPVITSLILPKTSSTLRVPLSLLVNETPVSYLMIDGPTPTNGLVPALPPKPAANDPRWLYEKPTTYNFGGIGSRTLFAWVKDLAGNVSDFRSAIVTINQCPEVMPVVCNENEELVPQPGTGPNGCPLAPVCKLKEPVACPSVCIPVYEAKNACNLNTCGSGCGADNINTFLTLEECRKSQTSIQFVPPTTYPSSTR